MSKAKERSSQLAFLLLCLLIAAQGYTIPVAPIGPSWAIWPTLPVIAALCFFAASLFACTSRPPRASQWLLIYYGAVVGGSLLSFLLVTISLRGLLLSGLSVDVNFAIYHFYILFFGGLVLWSTSRVKLTQRRRRVLQMVTAVTLFWVCTSVFLTYFDLVSTAAFAAHLPDDPSVAGAWIRYINAQSVMLSRQGLGTIGYNHAYVAAQILLLLALWFHLARSENSVLQPVLILLSLGAVLLSGSRSGLAAFVVFLFCVLFRRKNASLIAGIVLLLPLFALALWTLDTGLLESVLERQATLLEAPSTETLASRDIIWQNRLAFLSSNPTRWIIGTGFGSANASGENAHMLYLQVVLETGITGLIFFSALFAYIGRQLWLAESSPRYLFWATAALLFASLTQETFYPDPSMGFFIPFYLCTLALAFSNASHNRPLQKRYLAARQAKKPHATS